MIISSATQVFGQETFEDIGRNIRGGVQAATVVCTPGVAFVAVIDENVRTVSQAETHQTC